MTQNTQIMIFTVAKKYAAFALMILATLHANAQRSGLNISLVTNANIVDGKGVQHCKLMVLH